MTVGVVILGVVLVVLVLDKTVWRRQRNAERRERDRLHGR